MGAHLFELRNGILPALYMNAIVPMKNPYARKQPADQRMQPADSLDLCVMSSLDERTALAWRWNVV
jgi:hypothetical protein